MRYVLTLALGRSLTTRPADDIVLNAAVANITRRAPLRVLLPPAAINDYCAARMECVIALG